MIWSTTISGVPVNPCAKPATPLISPITLPINPPEAPTDPVNVPVPTTSRAKFVLALDHQILHRKDY